MRTDQINVILLIALISWGTAQILKTLIHFIKTKNFKAERLTGAGGMPSAHSATVCATAITTCRVCGICSPEFALAMILAMVVMYDAMGVRRSAGLQAKEINRLRRVVNELAVLVAADAFRTAAEVNARLHRLTQRVNGRVRDLRGVNQQLIPVHRQRRGIRARRPTAPDGRFPSSPARCS